MDKRATILLPALALVLAPGWTGCSRPQELEDQGQAEDSKAPEAAVAEPQIPDWPFATERHAAIDFIGRPVHDIRLETLEGLETSLYQDQGDSEILVLAFTQVGCPVALRYGPTLARLHETYGDRGVRFLGIDASIQDTGEEVAEQSERLELPFQVHLDPRQELLQALDVEKSTEVFVIDGEKRLRYRGAIADQFGVGTVKAENQHAFLEDAIEAVLAGKAPKIMATDAPGCIITRLETEQTLAAMPDRITYHEHIAPILQETCVPCHREGQVAPFPLTSYDDALGWSSMMSYVIKEQIMPPWYMSDHFDGEFVGQRSLSPRDEALLLKWIDSDKPEGDPALAPPPKTWPGGWAMQDFDMVLHGDMAITWRADNFLEPLPADGYLVPSEAALQYVEFASSHVFEEERWVTGLELIPTATSVVHHIGAFIIEPDMVQRIKRGDLKRRRGKKPLDEQVELVGVGFFGFYGPGAGPREYPEGYAKRIPKGAMMRFQVHYTADGTAHYDRPHMALRFAKTPPKYEVVTGSASNEAFELAPGESHRQVRAIRQIDRDMELVSLMPHMHYRGRQFRFLLRYPNGQVQSLLNVDYRFDWQRTYSPRSPIKLPAGSSIICSGIMDNSDANQWNPDPDAKVIFGKQSWDEMFLGYFDAAAELNPEGSGR